jgi:ribonuclease HI
MDNVDENAVNIFTDGSSYSNPRVGGMGFRIITINGEGHDVVHDHQPIGVQSATNQQMELLACIEALKLINGRSSPVDLSQFQRIIINTDSMYVVNGINSAKFIWRKTKWLTKDGAPVANAELWKQLVRLVQNTRPFVDFRWVKGHKSSLHNKAADKLAKNSARGATRKPVTVTSIRRKKTSKSVARGSVRLTGQRLTIRVITDEYLRVQKCYKFKYEVMSKSSLYFGNVDIAYSEHLLRAGHTYYVQMNKDSKNPRILKKYREVAK